MKSGFYSKFYFAVRPEMLGVIAYNLAIYTIRYIYDGQGPLRSYTCYAIVMVS
jgi:hypothetical protein